MAKIKQNNGQTGFLYSDHVMRNTYGEQQVMCSTTSSICIKQLY